LSEAFLGVERSLTGRFWRARQGPADVEESLRRRGVDPVAARVLAARGVTAETVGRVLAPRLRDELPDPSTLVDMDAAVEALCEAVEAGRAIVILADYDVDGGTSGALLLSWLRSLGARAEVFVPDRIRDGYGPSPAIVRKIKAAGADLLVTVDCGAAAHAALEEAHAIGLDVVVFDHHLMHAAPPPARAVVNPNRPDDVSGLGHLTAAGVVFVALVGLERAARARGLRPPDAAPFDLLSRLDLAALGTICDVAPLVGLNRAFVSQGLKVLNALGSPGLAALAKVAGLKKADGAYAAGWVLGPRLNAGGRVGDSSLAVRLLSTTDPAEAEEIAAELELLNAERRAIEANVLEEAIARVNAGEAGPLDGPLLMLGAPGWHPGVIGIVAGRLKERFHKPVIVVGSADPDDPIAKGSGRSVAGVNLGAAVAAATKERVLLAGGGHAMAAGLTVAFADLAGARADLSARLGAEERAAGDARELGIDALIGLSGATLSLVEALEQVGPYGAGWPEPVLAAADVRPFAAAPVGQNHVRVTLEDESGGRVRAVAFRALAQPLGDALAGRGRLHVALRLKRDDWRGGDAVDAEILDAAPATGG
jgi:single-stranded-DNA-specific exonuclease